MKKLQLYLLFALCFNASAKEPLLYKGTDNASLSKYERINHIESFLEKYAKSSRKKQSLIDKDLKTIKNLKDDVSGLKSKISTMEQEYRSLLSSFKKLGTNNRLMEDMKQMKENIIIIEKQVSRLHESNEFYKDSIKSLFREVNTLNTLKKK